MIFKEEKYLLYDAHKLWEAPVELVHERVQEGRAGSFLIQQDLGQQGLELLAGVRLWKKGQ